MKISERSEEIRLLLNLAPVALSKIREIGDVPVVTTLPARTLVGDILREILVPCRDSPGRKRAHPAVSSDPPCFSTWNDEAGPSLQQNSKRCGSGVLRQSSPFGLWCCRLLKKSLHPQRLVSPGHSRCKSRRRRLCPWAICLHGCSHRMGEKCDLPSHRNWAFIILIGEWRRQFYSTRCSCRYQSSSARS